MSRFLTGVSDLVKEQCRKTMLHNYMSLSRLIMYDQSIEESNLERRVRDMKRVRTDRKVNVGLKRGIQVKMFLVLLRLTMKEGMVLKLIHLLAPILGRNLLGSI